MEATIESVKVLVKKDNRKVLAAMGKLTQDDTRYSFSRVRITPRGVAVACDGRRLAAVHIGKGFAGHVVNIPGKLAGKVESIEMTGDEVMARTADGDVMLAKPDTAYPPLRDSVPFNHGDKIRAVVTVNPKLLAGLMEAVAKGETSVTLVIGDANRPIVVLPGTPDSREAGGGLLCTVFPSNDVKDGWADGRIAAGYEMVEDFRNLVADVDSTNA